MGLVVKAAEWDSIELRIAQKLAALAVRGKPITECLRWAEENATIVLPSGRQPFAPYDYQADILRDPSPRRLILKARQTGISNTVAIEALYYALHRSDYTTLFVSRTQSAASELIRYCQHVMTGLQNSVQQPIHMTQSELSWTNGSRIVSLPSTPSTGRGIAAHRVYLDEFAWCAYDQLLYEAIVPTLSPDAHLTVLSTPNGRTNLFFRLWQGLEGGDWSRYEIPWWRCPRYDEHWATTQKASITRQAWAQEYDLDFRTSGDAVFEPEELAQCQVGYNKAVVEGRRTVTAWDIGRRQDWTVGITVQEDDHGIWHVVLLDRFQAPYPEIQARIDARCLRFTRKAQHYVESNGIGDPVIENLEQRVLPFVTTARSKQQGLDSLKLLIQQGRFKFDHPQLDRELQLYQIQDGELVQDCVAACWILASAIEKGPAKVRFY